MKREFSTKPEVITEQWPGELTAFSWHDFVTSIPSPLFVVTTYKSNGKENACLQSWSCFVGDGGEFSIGVEGVGVAMALFENEKPVRSGQRIGHAGG